MERLTVEQLVKKAKSEISEIDVLKVEILSKHKSHLIIDIREPSEYAQGYIEGAINVPRGVLEFRTDPSYPGSIPSLYDKSAEIVLYCRSGARSALAAKSLIELGYKAVASMAGGYLAWEEAKLPVVVS